MRENNSDLISRSALRKEVGGFTYAIVGLNASKSLINSVVKDYMDYVLKKIDEAPSADENADSPGEWIEEPHFAAMGLHGRYFVCPRCNVCLPPPTVEYPSKFYDFCPRCGKPMKGLKYSVDGSSKIEMLHLSKASENQLKNCGFSTVQDIIEGYRHGQLSTIHGIRKKTEREVIEALKGCGYVFSD